MQEEPLSRDELVAERDRLLARKTQLELKLLIADPRAADTDAIRMASTELASIHERLPPLEWGVLRSNLPDVTDAELCARMRDEHEARALLAKMLDRHDDLLAVRDTLFTDYTSAVAERTGMIERAEDLEARLNNLDPDRNEQEYTRLSLLLDTLYGRLPVIDMRMRDLEDRLDDAQRRIVGAAARYHDVEAIAR